MICMQHCALIMSAIFIKLNIKIPKHTSPNINIFNMYNYKTSN